MPWDCPYCGANSAWKWDCSVCLRRFPDAPGMQKKTALDRIKNAIKEVTK